MKRNRIRMLELSLNSAGVFVGSSGVLNTIRIIFGKFSVHIWRRCGGFWACQEMLKWHTNSKHAPEIYQTWKFLYAKQPTLDQTYGWGEDNYIKSKCIGMSCIYMLYLHSLQLLNYLVYIRVWIQKTRGSKNTLGWTLFLGSRLDPSLKIGSQTRRLIFLIWD